MPDVVTGMALKVRQRNDFRVHFTLLESEIHTPLVSAQADGVQS
ncbi:MAG TPA: hypothetical protein VK358_17660 [Longimicrobium sp.]|nr:hypothetical protein [Longimicrobium sp.]